jgi:hypothetical protein
MPPTRDELISSILQREPHLSREEAERRAAQIIREGQPHDHPDYYNEPPVNYHEDVARDQILPFMRENVDRLGRYVSPPASDIQDRIARMSAAKAQANAMQDRIRRRIRLRNTQPHPTFS